MRRPGAAERHEQHGERERLGAAVPRDLVEQRPQHPAAEHQHDEQCEDRASDHAEQPLPAPASRRPSPIAVASASSGTNARSWNSRMPTASRECVRLISSWSPSWRRMIAVDDIASAPPTTIATAGSSPSAHAVAADRRRREQHLQAADAEHLGLHRDHARKRELESEREDEEHDADLRERARRRPRRRRGRAHSARAASRPAGSRGSAGSAKRRTRLSTSTEPASRIRICESTSPAMDTHRARPAMLAFRDVPVLPGPRARRHSSTGTHSMGFQATLSDARDRLRIAGDCRMADAPVLDTDASRASRALRRRPS